MTNLKSLSRKLRTEPTDAEKKLWLNINRNQLGVKFRRQYPIAGYIADFICVPRRLIIEVDGGQHNDEIDAKRTEHLKAAGYHIMRFWNNEVLQNIDGVLRTIIDHLSHSS